MRSINVSFRETQRKNPDLGDYICLVQTVRGRGFSPRTIRQFFTKFIPKDDYDHEDLKALINQLHIASNIVEDVHFERKIALFDVESMRGLTMYQT